MLIAVLVAVQHDRRLQALCERLVARGRKPIVALDARARKMLVIINAKQRDMMAEAFPA